MESSKLTDINGIEHIGDLPSAKKGIIDYLSGDDKFKETIPTDKFNSYKKGREIAVEIENIMKGDQRTY